MSEIVGLDGLPIREIRNEQDIQAEVNAARQLTDKEFIELKGASPKYLGCHPDGAGSMCYFYGLTGWLGGDHLRLATWKGELMGLLAPSRSIADEIAADGLRMTLEGMREKEYQKALEDAVNRGTTQQFSGTRDTDAPPGTFISPELRVKIENEIAGELTGKRAH